MLNEHRRRQNIFLVLLLIGSLGAGAALAVVYEGWFLLWWQRTLVFIVAVICATIGVSALSELLDLREQIKEILKLMRVNSGPTAAPLHTPGKPGPSANNGWDIFGGRRGG